MTKKKKTKARVRSDVRVSPDLAEAIAKVSSHLGMTKQSLMVAAATRYLVDVLPLTTVKKKTAILVTLEKEFQKALEDTQPR